MFEPGQEGRLGREGVERREALLARLRPVVERRGRSRRAAALGGACVVALAAGVLSARLVGGAAGPVPVGAGAGCGAVAVFQVEEKGDVGAAAEPVVELVATSKGIAERVGTATTPVARASDEELMAALRATGQDPGLVRVEGRVVIAGDLGRGGTR